VLLIDDEDDLVWSLGRRLQRALQGVQVKSTTRAEVLLSARGSCPFDAVVTDIRMPNVSGLEVLIAARKKWPALPFAVMTAYPADFMRAVAPRAGALGYLEKPFELSALVRAVEGALAQASDPSFPAAAARNEAFDLLQVSLLSNLSGTLHLSQEGRAGAVWFDRGRVTHAACPGARGAAAFSELATWGSATFAFERDTRPSETTVVESPTELVLSAFACLEAAVSAPEAPPADAATSPSSTPTGGAESPTGRPPPNTELPMANEVQSALENLRSIDGYIGACVVDSESGMTLGTDGGSGVFNLEIAGAGNTEVVRAKRKAMKALNLRDEIEDMLITLGKQYHLIRPVRSRPGMFVYLALDRARANLAMARITLTDAERKLTL
jgi:FixJ family two-component response regulator